MPSHIHFCVRGSIMHANLQLTDYPFQTNHISSKHLDIFPWLMIDSCHISGSPCDDPMRVES